MSIIRKEQLTNPLSASYAETASIAVSSSYAQTASYAENAGVTVDTGSLLTTASVLLNIITFTKGDGSTFPITVDTGSGGGGIIDTGSLVTTSSFNAYTASIDSFTSSINAFTASYNTGSFTGSFTGSLLGTSSWAVSASQALSSSFYREIDPIFTARSSSLATTGSNTFRGNQVISGSGINTILQVHGANAEPWAFGIYNDTYNPTQSVLAGFVDNTGEASIGTEVNKPLYIYTNANYANPTLTISSSGVTVGTGGITGSLFGTSSWASNALLAVSASNYQETDPIFVAKSSSLATTGSNTFIGNQTITGSLVVTNNFTVLGSASIQYISESTLNIGTNLITVNTFNPSVRFGGLAVIDSGSSPLTSASFLYDSVQDEFIFVHRGDGVNITSSHFVLGPETYNNQGNEIYLTANRIPKGVGNEHLNDSNISDNGSLVNINSNTNITGSLLVSGSQNVTGSFKVYDGTSNNIDSSTRYLYDSINNISVNWQGKQLNDSSNILSIDWANRILKDTTNTLSIDWENRTLNDANGNPITNFSNPTITQHYAYFNKTYDNTDLESFSSTFNYAGVVLTGVTLVSPATLYDLVYLDGANGWTQVDNTESPVGTNLKLGIVVVDNSGTGNVLLEGDIIVDSGTGGVGPKINSSGVVKPGDTIYIAETNPYPAASLANDMPGTGATLRTLGHLYYQNQNTNNDYFILRFNPSNDYYYLS